MQFAEEFRGSLGHIGMIGIKTYVLPLTGGSNTGTMRVDSLGAASPVYTVGVRTISPRYFQTLVLQALLESTASEFGARMTAMTSATDNAGNVTTATLTYKVKKS